MTQKKEVYNGKFFRLSVSPRAGDGFKT